jgi:hypothetical protein
MSEVITIDGELEALGDYIIAPLGIKYRFLRFLTHDNRAIMLRNVGVGDDMHSYLKPGLRGRFCYYSHGTSPHSQILGDLTCSMNFLLGYNSGNRIVVESDKKYMKTNRFLSGTLAIFALLLSIVIIGVPWLISLIISLFTSTPSEEDVYRKLASYTGK